MDNDIFPLQAGVNVAKIINKMTSNTIFELIKDETYFFFIYNHHNSTVSNADYWQKYIKHATDQKILKITRSEKLKMTHT